MDLNSKRRITMNKITQNMQKNIIATTLSFALAIPCATVIAATGEVGSRAHSSGIEIKIADTDEIETYTVFERNGSKWAPLKGYELIGV